MIRPPSDSGAVTLPVVALVAVGLAAALGLGRLSDAVVVRARADAVADLTALAGAVGGAEAASAIAAANGGALDSFVPGTGAAPSVTVGIEVGGARSAASAVAS